MRKSFVALLLLLGASASMTSLALAQTEDLRGDLANKLINAHSSKAGMTRAARQSPARINDPFPGTVDSVWVGHSILHQSAGNFYTYSWGPFHVGVGRNRPSTNPANPPENNSGIWDWDHFFVTGGGDPRPTETDSLQGWWPMRRAYSITGGLTLADTDRPWWAVDIGNQGNYVLTNAQGRTRGVLGYWHVDGGSGAAQVRIAGTNAPNPSFAPLSGTSSAWCGLRGHGDITYSDPITGNAYNATLIEFNGENGGGAGSGVGTSKAFPGYPGQMDQMLYRDVEMTSAAATLNLGFLYQTAMSTAATSSAATRTGWFQFDPTTIGTTPVVGPNNGIANYIPNTAVGQPADSFMVYLAVPVDVQNVFLADGSHHTGPGAVYDPKRRWFSEVARLDMPIQEVLHVSGNNNSTFSLAAAPLSAFYTAQNAFTHKYLRIIFRVKTNRNFDDNAGGVAGQFNSGHVGAALIDDVSIGGANLSGAALGTSGFEAPTDIDNGSAGSPPADAITKWKSTGKPPSVFFHAHPMAGGDIGGGNPYDKLVYQDICGPPTATARFCNMAGVVISAGDHDNGEAAGGLAPAASPGGAERERMDGMCSPTILLASTGNSDYNAVGVNLADATTLDDYYVFYDIYTGVFNLFFTGNAWWFGFQSYPAAQSDGTVCWGEFRVPGFQIFNPDIQCLQDVEGAKQNGLIRTTNPGSRPDSMRIYLGKNQQCFRFGVTGSGCSPKSGCYFDNVSLLLSDASASGSSGGSISMDIWRFINDAFPINDNTSPVPGVAVAPGSAGFDTAAAQVKTGINTAQSPGSANRFDIPGDSIIVIGDVVESTTGKGRVDLVFRIKPGPGNYVTIGDPTSGLRRVPTDADPTHKALAGVLVSDPAHPEKDFWAAYMGNPGEMGRGIHGPAADYWNRNVWNSARIDTAEVNLFPVQSNAGVFDVNVNFFGTVNWMACYHEDDPKYSTLGVSHNRCFIVNPGASGPVNSTNITCNSVPGWVNAAAGYDGVPTTKEGTKIIPDGLLTPGSHVEYFFRAQDDGGHGAPGLARNDAHFIMSPETTFVSPQNTEGSTDGHRWQEFSVLPDRWKDPLFTDAPRGQGMACMLYVDLADRRGEERAWVSLADTLGLTADNRRGAHNGWRARGDQAYTAPDGSPIDISTDPSIARYDHGGQPGTTWDMYGVKAAELPTTGAGQLGGREGVLADGLAAGKDARFGPTTDMLRTYYKVLVLLSGDISMGVLGKFINRGANDVVLLQDFLTVAAPGTPATTRRAIYIGGSGFVQSEYKTGSTGTFAEHLSLLTDYLGVTIKRDGSGNPQYSYQPWSGNLDQYETMTTADPGPMPNFESPMGNNCRWGNDVLDRVANGLNASVSSYYENAGTNGPYVSGVFTPVQAGKFYQSFVDGFDLQYMYRIVDHASIEKAFYMDRVLSLMESVTQCLLFIPCGDCPLGVPGATGKPLTDCMALFNNPMISGHATVHFGIAHPDRVTARIYDVGGRLVRTLADRSFPPGLYDLAWDGSDDRGRAMPRGVYFTEIHYTRTGFRETKKLTVLR